MASALLRRLRAAHELAHELVHHIVVHPVYGLLCVAGFRTVAQVVHDLDGYHQALERRGRAA